MSGSSHEHVHLLSSPFHGCCVSLIALSTPLQYDRCHVVNVVCCYIYGHTALIAATITGLKNHRHAHTADITHLQFLISGTGATGSSKNAAANVDCIFSGAWKSASSQKLCVHDVYFWVPLFTQHVHLFLTASYTVGWLSIDGEPKLPIDVCGRYQRAWKWGYSYSLCNESLQDQRCYRLSVEYKP